MDLLLSLPIASYFFSSSLTSWSTSLNLLFFYMTWSTLVLSHSPLKIELLGTTGLRLVFWLLPSLLFLLLDTLLPSLAVPLKHNGSSALPPRDAKALARLLALAILNLSLSSALEGALSLGTATLLGAPVFRTATTLPLPWQMAKHIGLLFLAREILTYYIHRHILHAHAPNNLTRRISTQHKRCAHARTSSPPFSLLLMADHPLPFLLHRFIPIYLPALVMHRHLHLLTYFLFVGLATIEETLAMSGYNIVPGIIMGGIARRSALHYVRPSGNFGAWGVLDWLHGTSLGGDVMRDVKDEAEKHKLKERGEKKAEGVADGIGEAWGQVKGKRRSPRFKNEGA